MSGTPPLLSGRRVLIVEDQFLIAEEMRRAIESLGGTVVGPAPGLAAARRLLESGMPDMALLDINLGEAQVWPIAQELRDRGVPLIFASGYEAGDLDPHFALELLLEKPVTVRVLAAAVQKLALPPVGDS